MANGQTPFYNNASLKKYYPADEQEIELPVRRSAPPPPFALTALEQGPSIDERLAMARGTLARADELEASIPVDEIDEDPTELPSFGRFMTGGLSKMSIAPGLAALAPTPASPALATLSALMAAPDVVRRLIAPEEDESRTGAVIEGGLQAFPIGQGIRQARKLSQASKAYEAAAPVRGAVEYAGERAGAHQAAGLSRKQAMKKASIEAGWPLGKSKASIIRHLPQIPEERALNIRRPPSAPYAPSETMQQASRHEIEDQIRKRELYGYQVPDNPVAQQLERVRTRGLDDVPANGAAQRLEAMRVGSAAPRGRADRKWQMAVQDAIERHGRSPEFPDEPNLGLEPAEDLLTRWTRAQNMGSKRVLASVGLPLSLAALSRQMQGEP